jgi:extracellular elastinolytic metalloproteinase
VVSPRRLLWAALIPALLAFVGAPGGTSATTAEPRVEPGQFLTGANAGKPLDIALDYIRAHRAELGLTEQDVTGLAVASQYTDAHNAVTHIYFQQRQGGIDVFGGVASVNIAKNGAVMNLGSSLVGDVAGKAGDATPAVGAVAAVQAAAGALGLPITSPLTVVSRDVGPAQRTELSRGGIALTPIAAKLVYERAGTGLRLAWDITINEYTSEHWWQVGVDADTGTLLRKGDLIVHDNAGLTSAALGRAETRRVAGRTTSAVADGSSYLVYDRPKENPNTGDRVIVHTPADATASPFGWHDTNGAAGHEFTTTRGNNAHAYIDHASDSVPDPSPGGEPSNPSLDFHFPFDQSKQPIEYQEAAVTNLFYWNNIMHDVFYRYGFTEAAGNFQQNNYGRGGVAADYVLAEAQDGSGANNANFATPVNDGSTATARPRMQMFLWTPPQLVGAVDVAPPSPVQGTYPAGIALFGPPNTPVGDTGQVALANDGAGVSQTDGCEPYVGFPAGRIAIVDRGNCNFALKVKNGELAGAIAVIVANNAPGNPINMAALNTGTTPPTVDPNGITTIPSVMVSQDAGKVIKANLPLTATVRLNASTSGPLPPARDGDFDSGVIAHEYGHGISNRLTGGPVKTSGCLGNQEQMGEGWSDYMGLVLTAVPSDSRQTDRGVGNYVLYQGQDAGGIRPTAYSTSTTVNPSTYDSIKTAAVPHGVGYVWATMLWEVYWNLVERHGFNPNVYETWETAGNNLAIQLVVDGMKLQKCSPGFVDGRNAILLADQALTAGANTCLIWKGFAKRGLGFSAVQGSSGSVTDGTQAFDMPPSCAASIAVTPASLSATQESGKQTTQTVKVANGAPEGAAALTWTVTEAAADCASPSDLAWLAAAPADGSTAAGSSTDVTVSFDSAGMAASEQRTGKLCFASNDPARAVLEVPVTLRAELAPFTFTGFFGISNPPTLNQPKAGSTVNASFGLGGARGLDVLAQGSPTSQPIDCTTKAATGAASATTGTLIFSATTGRYTYAWTTQRAWAKTCREFVLTLADGSQHNAYFKFK